MTLGLPTLTRREVRYWRNPAVAGYSPNDKVQGRWNKRAEINAQAIEGMALCRDRRHCHGQPWAPYIAEPKAREADA